MKSQCICLLGGHLSPAQAIAESLRTHYPEYNILFIGRKQEFTSSTHAATELTVMSDFGEVISINPPRRLLFPWNWLSFFLSFFTCLSFFIKKRPVYVVSFGSYVSLPAVVAAMLLRIPIAVHEQTRSLSAANRFAARNARIVGVTDTQVDSKGALVTVTGFPFRESLFTPMLGAAFSVPSGVPLLFVGGGTTGALAINELLFPIIKDLIPHMVVIHQTGSISFDKAVSLKESLLKDYSDRYLPQIYISSESMNWVYKNMSLIISRSGANTVYELAAFDQRAILIPLPESKEHEQEQLAKWFISHYDSIFLSQDTVTSEVLRDEIFKQLSHQKQHHPNVLPVDGAKRFVDAMIKAL